MAYKQVPGDVAGAVSVVCPSVSGATDNPLIRKVLTCNKSNLKRNLLFLLSVLIYRVCLDVIYIQCIAPFWGYYNLTYEPEPLLAASSWAILVFSSFFVLPFLNKPDSIVSIAGVLFFFIRFVPFTSFIACKAQPVNFVLLECVYWLLIFFLLSKGKNICVPNLTQSDTLICSLAVVLALIVIFISGRYTHFRLNFNLLNVYELRAEAREFNMPSILFYLWAPASNVLPIILIFLLKKKNILFAIFISLIIFLNFSINGSKSTLFKLLFCLFLYFFMKKELLSKVPYLFVLLVIATLIEWYFNVTTVISTFVVRRVLYVPSLLDSLFYDYIQQTGPLYYNQGDVNITFLIGEKYFGDEDMMANNGMFSDAYMNLGWVGCLIYPFLYAFFFKICDSAFREVNRQIVFFVGLLIVTTIGSSVFTTALLTHGIFLLCLITYLLPREVDMKTV